MLRDGSGAYPVIKFNIIYIMRTYIQVCGLCRPGHDSWGFTCGQPGQRQLLVPLNQFIFQPAISRWILPAAFCCLVFDCPVLLRTS